jgi:uncharacterized protein (DUF488 family)
MNTIYTIGYRAPGAMHKVEALVQAGARLVDIRLVPGSRYYPEWTRKALQQRFGWQYYEHLALLGNLNYAHPERPMRLRDAEHGLDWLHIFVKQRNIILLCGCPDFKRCHRLLVCNLFLQRVPDAHIVHLAPREALTPVWCEQPHSREVEG